LHSKISMEEVSRVCSILKSIKAASTTIAQVWVFHLILIKYFTGGKFRGVIAMKCVYCFR
jgi:hypothetical protein